MKKNIGIVGTHGIPANYSGWETLVENLVINRKNISYLIATPLSRKNNQPKIYKDMSIYIPLRASGWQSIFYDLISMIFLLRKCDQILVLGVSGCIFLPLIRLFTDKNILVNTDGIEYKRKKWGYVASKFLWLSEWFAVKYATKIIADNEGISQYIKQKYKTEVHHVIAYGGIDNIPKKQIHKKKYNFQNKSFDLVIARIVPENNIELILNVYNKLDFNLIIIGNWESSNFSKNLKEKKWNKNINLFESDFDIQRLASLRSCCRYYIHGHSAGGTNPSLVEAISLGCNILCYDVNFNRNVLAKFGYFWKNEEDLFKILNSKKLVFDKKNLKKYYNQNFDWAQISKKYEEIF